MVYISHDKLPIIEIDKGESELSIYTLIDFLKIYPANIIYVELDGILYGLFSSGTVRRALIADEANVKIRRNFTKIAPGEYMRAYQLFKDKPTVNAIPVVTSNGILLGEYSRWNDAIVYAHQDFAEIPMLGCMYAKDFWAKKPVIAMIPPCEVFSWKVNAFKAWRDYLKSMGATVHIVERDKLGSAPLQTDIFLFADEDELIGAKSLQLCMAKDFTEQATTYCKFASHIYNGIGNVVNSRSVGTEEILREIESSGAHVLTINSRENSGAYCNEMIQKLRARKLETPKGTRLLKTYYQGFYSELDVEEYSDIVSKLPFDVHPGRECRRLKDTVSPYYNVIDGRRITVGQQCADHQEILFFGPCIMLGFLVEDRYTIASLLQQKLNQAGVKCRVQNCGCLGDLFSTLREVLHTQFHEGDILIIYSDDLEFKKVRSASLWEILEKHNVPEAWLEQNIIHVNHKVNMLYSEAIHGCIKDWISCCDTETDRKEIILNPDLLLQPYLSLYFSSHALQSYGRVGSIVMNCNPFTLGHRYLIECASEQCDFLIVFVVEEDDSLFPFDIRLAFVKEGTVDLNNMLVVPSGNFILSRTTFPEYFVKIADEDIIQNVEYDITLFAEQIAPRLGITCRFVGEEPEDGVTREYNEAMKRILPASGIDLIEIPRLTLEDGQIVSASAARKALEENDMEELNRLVPESTKQILFWENK